MTEKKFAFHPDLYKSLYSPYLGLCKHETNTFLHLALYSTYLPSDYLMDTLMDLCARHQAVCQRTETGSVF